MVPRRRQAQAGDAKREEVKHGASMDAAHGQGPSRSIPNKREGQMIARCRSERNVKRDWSETKITLNEFVWPKK